MARATPRGEPPSLVGVPSEPGPPAAAAEELGGAAARAGPETGPGQARRPSPGPRRVLFADEALGLPLAQLRRYQPWGCAGFGGGGPDDDDDDDDDDPAAAAAAAAAADTELVRTPPFYLLPGFVLPPAPGRLERLRGSMVELEDLLPPEDTPGRTPVLRGLIRVLNLSYHKAVHVRATHDGWLTFRDHPAHYVPGGSSFPEDGGQTDRFAFQLPFEPARVGARVQDGARIDFVVRYQTPEATYWANNQGRNYTVVLKETGAAAAAVAARAPARKQHLLWEVETKQLKSCMKPGRHRQSEEELRRETLDDPVSSMECLDDGDRGSECVLVTPLPLQPGSQIIQVSDVMVASSPEYLPETVLPSPQSPSIEIPPSVLHLGPGQGGAMLGAEEEVLSHLASPTSEQPSESPRDECLDLFRSDEAQTEDAVDLELEQFYLSHLSRWRAEEAAHGASGGGPITGPDQGLFLKWMGPERALNSSLAKEITMHYAMQSVQGMLELLEDPQEDAGSHGGDVEELRASLAAEEEEESVEGDTLKESPPGIVTGMWLAGQHPGFILVKDGLSQDAEEEEIWGSGCSFPPSWAVPEKKATMEKECGHIDAIKAQGPSSCFQEGSNLLTKSITAQTPSGIGQGEGLWELPSQLQRALNQSLCVLGLLVFMPIVWNACMAFMGLAFYLSLAWFS